MTQLDLAAVSRDINARLAPIFREFQNAENQHIAKAARADPQRYRLTTVMAEGKLSYRHWGGVKDKRGRTIKFCWSSHRNVAGYFLAWREIETPIKRKRPAKVGECVSTIVRDQWTARKTKQTLKDLQERRTDALRERHPKAEPKTKTFWVSLRKDAASRGLGKVVAADELKAAEKARVKWGDREIDGWTLRLIRFAK